MYVTARDAVGNAASASGRSGYDGRECAFSRGSLGLPASAWRDRYRHVVLRRLQPVRRADSSVRPRCCPPTHSDRPNTHTIPRSPKTGTTWSSMVRSRVCSGVWRRATQKNAPLEQVAGGDSSLPSVSADGRYVSFTTNEGSSLPMTTDGEMHLGVREAPGVYVRDMERRAHMRTPPGAFTLASAKNHSALSLRLFISRRRAPNSWKSTRRASAPQPSGRSAITADGRTVAFVTTAWSDLAGARKHRRCRSRSATWTVPKPQLVSVRYDPETGKVGGRTRRRGNRNLCRRKKGSTGPFGRKAARPNSAPKRSGRRTAYSTPQIAGAVDQRGRKLLSHGSAARSGNRRAC